MTPAEWITPMAVDTIRRLYFTPPVVVARLGGSLTPLDAFDWVAGDPHTVAETRIRPTWALDVMPDATVLPRLTRELMLRDGPLLRPVAPFLELWALTGDGPTQNWQPRPVSPELLAANGASPADLTFSVTAMNLKAARRTGNPALGFGTFPAVQIRGDDHRPTPLLGTSPSGTAPAMIPPGRSIPLGQLQVLRPATHPVGQPWSDVLRLDTIRVRFTPARGRFYGPPVAATVTPPAVVPDRAFLDPDAGWLGAAQGNRVIPGDTVDELSDEISLGVVDDTCDARITVELALAGTPLRGGANITVAPPHYAPDRRPFLSVADELNDRQHDPARDVAMSQTDRDEWVEDLFERIFETVAAMDVDLWRAAFARTLNPSEQRSQIPGDGVPLPNRAMGGTDALRDANIAIPAPSRIEPLPLTQRARERHRNLSDIRQLAPWVLANPGRLAALIRPPLSGSAAEFGRQRMQMPPFMRHSNAGPLSLARWQYDLLMAWAEALDEAGLPGTLGAQPGGDLLPLSPAAEQRRRQVLSVLGEELDSDDAGGAG
jgi:hypothetical protein